MASHKKVYQEEGSHSANNCKHFYRKKKMGKTGVLFTDHLKKSIPPIFYCAPILSRKDNIF